MQSFFSTEPQACQWTVTDCSGLLSLRSRRYMLVKEGAMQAGQARAKPRLAWTRQRPLEVSKGDQFWGASESLVTNAMDAAERGMATFAGITYSPCTSYLHHTAMTLTPILTPHHANPRQPATFTVCPLFQTFCILLHERPGIRLARSVTGTAAQQPGRAWSSSAAGWPAPGARRRAPSGRRC